ncbi:MAG: DUF58 domain-containing protein [Elusimicrobia bacterium]|nr:DUF58 domain-containing protein [Elusimicrobiota bacterium]
MISSELIAKVKRLEITSAKLVQEIFSGQYQSVFKGRGLEFSDLREYQWGDDIRAMHWRALARSGGRPYIKRFIEEREMTLVLAIDVSLSLEFGSGQNTKTQVAQDLGGILAYMALQNKDRIGLLMFSDRRELFLPPRGGRLHALRLMRELVAGAPSSPKTNIKLAAQFLLQGVKKRSVIFFMSDFIDQDFEKEFSILGKKHDLIAVTISDPIEEDLPSIPARLRLTDAEGNASIMELDLREKKFLGLLKQDNALKRQSLRDFLARSRIDHLELSTTRHFVDDLVLFFRKREHQIERGLKS